MIFALGIFGRHVGRPGLWRDEAATIAVVRRSFVEILQLSGQLDLVHLAYYLCADLSWAINGSVTAVRWISVIAMSLAAGMLVPIGRRLGSVRVGLLAGLLLTASPFASRYAQEARPFATATLVGTICTYLMLRLLQEPSRRLQIAYAAGVIALGLFNILALMLVVSHAPAVWLLGDRPARRRWAVPAVVGLLVVAPFVLFTSTQVGQVSWIARPHLFDLRALLTQEFGSRAAPLAVAVILVLVLAVRQGTARLGWSDWSGWPSTPSRSAARLGLTWAVLPPALLFAVSLVHPLWDVHYLVFSLPGLALLLAGLAPGVDSPSALRSAVAMIAPVLLIATLGLNAQITYRDATVGHEENLVAITDYLGEHVVPGDAVLYLPAELRVLGEIAPESLAGLDDVAVERTPMQASNLVGTPIDPAGVSTSLRSYDRVWVVEGLFKSQPTETETASRSVLEQEFERLQEVAPEIVTDVEVTLYGRRPE